MDLDPGDCECEAFWMSVNRASDEETFQLAGYDDPTDASDSIFVPVTTHWATGTTTAACAATVA